MRFLRAWRRRQFQQHSQLVRSSRAPLQWTRRQWPANISARRQDHLERRTTDSPVVADDRQLQTTTPMPPPACRCWRTGRTPARPGWRASCEWVEWGPVHRTHRGQSPGRSHRAQPLSWLRRAAAGNATPTASRSEVGLWTQWACAAWSRKPDGEVSDTDASPWDCCDDVHSTSTVVSRWRRLGLRDLMPGWTSLDNCTPCTPAAQCHDRPSQQQRQQSSPLPANWRRRHRN